MYPGFIVPLLALLYGPLILHLFYVKSTNVQRIGEALKQQYMRR